jgi:hypothetical protein
VQEFTSRAIDDKQLTTKSTIIDKQRQITHNNSQQITKNKSPPPIQVAPTSQSPPIILPQCYNTMALLSHQPQAVSGNISCHPEIDNLKHHEATSRVV